MLFNLFLFTIISVPVRTSCVKYCEILSRDDPNKQCYVKETLVGIAHSPNQLAVDRQSNHLYFSFDSGLGEYTAAVYKLDSKEMTVLKGVNDAFAIAVDPSSRDVYFGGSYGIYKYNPVLQTLRRLNIQNLDIWWIFVKRYVYFIKFPSLKTYCYVNGTITADEQLKDNLVQQMVIDVDNYKFFINNTGLYGIKKKKNQAVLLRDSPRFLSMATDNNGYVFICSEDGIYIVSKLMQKVKKILSLQGVLGFTFDNSNNIIYSTSHEL
ncbi:Uncharacterized protein OBRU01_16162, partial [Operophtera brumata]